MKQPMTATEVQCRLDEWHRDVYMPAMARVVEPFIEKAERRLAELMAENAEKHRSDE